MKLSFGLAPFSKGFRIFFEIPVSLFRNKLLVLRLAEITDTIAVSVYNGNSSSLDIFFFFSFLF